MMKTMRGMMIGAAIVLMTSAGLAQSADVRLVNEPLAGVARTVSVGSPVHERSRYLLVEETVTTVDEKMKGGQYLIPLTVMPDQPLTQVTSKASFKACTDNGSGPCGLDDDGDGIFDRMARDDISLAIKLKRPARYTIRRQTKVRDDPSNFKQVILYVGATGDTLRLSYREFTNDMARPAFTEDLSIPITKTFPQMVAVKDIKLRLISIDGMGLRYEIVE